jgi:hypothetical protein
MRICDWRWRGKAACAEPATKAVSVREPKALRGTRVFCHNHATDYLAILVEGEAIYTQTEIRT